MKSMSCKDLGGACDQVFQAETFEEIAAMSRQHGMEMFQQGEVEHLKALAEMRNLMQSPEVMEKWIAERRAAFDALPED